MNKDAAFALLEEWRTPRHVREHSVMVSRAATFLALRLDANVALCEVAGILHDMVRVVDFRSFNPETWPYKYSDDDIEFWRRLREKYHGRHHADVAAEILRSLDEEALARVIEQHKFIQIRDGFDSMEAKIVYYADKRVKHDRVVTLEERLADGRKRNKPELLDSPDENALDEAVTHLENELCEKAGIKAEELVELNQN